jgi:aldehyde dehydrogenase (NAD+)
LGARQCVRKARHSREAIAWIEQSEGDITDLIIDELGGTRLKAFIEILLVRNSLKEASTYPMRMKGEIIPSAIDGKENRLIACLSEL